MIEIIEKVLKNLNFLSFIYIVIVFFASYGLSKIDYIKNLFRREGDEVDIHDPDNFHILDKIFFVVGIILIVYLLVTGSVDKIIKFLRAYNIVTVSLLMIGIPLVLLVVFIKKIGRFFENEQGFSRILYGIFVEFCLHVFYASFLTLVIPFVLYLVK